MNDYLVIADGYTTVTRQADLDAAITFVRELSVRPLIAHTGENGVTFTVDKPRSRKTVFALRAL